jgi:F1F0 ATPase subunit 2
MSGLAAVLDFGAGAILGLLFYGGLWMTVRALPVTRHPIALTLSSVTLRTAAVLSGLWLVAGGRWQNALACVAGFVIGRIAVSRVVLRCI